MTRFQLVLNNRDISAALNKWSLSYQRIKVQGPNQGVSQGGSLIEDVVKVKDVMTFSGNAVDEETFRFLANAAEANFVTCQYQQPVTGNQVTRQMVATLSAATVLPVDGRPVYMDWSLTLEER